MKRILLVDDDALVLKSIKRLLERYSYFVISAKCSHEALSILEKEEVDLVISDIRMPDEDGLLLGKKIREISDCPLIYVTGYASEDAPIDAIKLGAKDYLLKPFDLDELLASVKRHIG